MAQPDIVQRDYYTLSPGGKIVSLPVRERPECLEIQLMDAIGRKLPGLCLALGAVLVTYHYGWWIVPAMAGAAIVHKAAKNLGWW